MTSLYVCYQSLLDPLTLTQVVNYLEGLTLSGFQIVLLTYEPRPLSHEETARHRAELATKGITWYWLRYHKRPTVPATAYDVAVGIAFGLHLVRRHNVRLVHARSHVAGLIGVALKRLAGVKFLFDVRGFMAEEYVDAGVWPAGGLLFRTTKRVERSLLAAADAVVVLTHRGEAVLRSWYPRVLARKPITVIPCCVDLRREESVSRSAEPLSLVYAGKLGGWYLNEEMVAFFAAARDHLPGLRWQIWTQSDPSDLLTSLKLRGLDPFVSIGCVPPDELHGLMTRAWAALALIKTCPSKVASSPTKVGEYLAAGLPVISTAGIGDLDALLNDSTGELGGAVGIVLPDCTDASFRKAIPALATLLDDPTLRERCIRAARLHFDLRDVGWLRYHELYHRLLGA